MSSCLGGAVNGVGGAQDASVKTETKQSIAYYENRKNETNPTFKSYAEKYAYLKGKAVCAPCQQEQEQPE